MSDKSRGCFPQMRIPLFQFSTLIPRELLGSKVASLDELRAAFPEDNFHHPVVESEHEGRIRLYTRPMKIPVPGDSGRLEAPDTRSLRSDHVAYYCTKVCDGIIVGPPSEAPYNHLRPLSGSKGTRVNCRNCGSRLYDSVEARS